MSFDQDEYLMTGVRVLAQQKHNDRFSGMFYLLPSCPLFKGHFPGHPVFPAVGQLQLAITLCERAIGRHVIVRRVPIMKCHRPLAPDAKVSFELVLNGEEQQIRWCFFEDEHRASEGYLIFD